jgi:1-acyl-sn-glycerol-3-phosphate acyltransferase
MGTMQHISSWLVILACLLRYFLYRLGLGAKPELYDRKYDVLVLLWSVLKWGKRMRRVHAERCPKSHPVIFCGNHSIKDDPFIMEASIHLSTGLWIHHMMRNDYFGKDSATFLYDPYELLRMLGTYTIDRAKPTISQLKAFVRLLSEGESFLMFPGRTRSRSGLFMEYRDNITEPGGPSWFAAHAKRSSDVCAAVAPVTRTFNIMDKTSAIVFGEALSLPAEADRDDQRALDRKLIENMGQNTEVHAAHLVGGIVYLRALHKHALQFPSAELVERCKDVLRALNEDRLLHPSLQENVPEAVEEAVEYFVRCGMLAWAGEELIIEREAVLAAPELTAEYRRKNPVKFCVNQILHLSDVTAALNKLYRTRDAERPADRKLTEPTEQSA